MEMSVFTTNIKHILNTVNFHTHTQTHTHTQNKHTQTHIYT